MKDDNRESKDPPSLYRPRKGRKMGIANHRFDESNGPRVMFSVNLPVKLRDRFKKKCYSEGLSVSGVLTELISDHLGPDEDEDWLYK